MNIVSILFNGVRSGVPEYSSAAGYSPEWMNRLVRGFQRNSRLENQYFCVVDSPSYEFIPEVQPVPLQNSHPGWGCIMEAFRPDICSGHRLIAGLDTIIVNNVDSILSWRGECGLLDDPYRAKIGSNDLCNGIGIFSESQCNRLWHLWQNRYRLDIPILYNGAESEMMFLRSVVPWAERLNRTFAHSIQSYKAHWRDEPQNRAGAKIVYFHGDPKPPHIDRSLLKHWI